MVTDNQIIPVIPNDPFQTTNISWNREINWSSRNNFQPDRNWWLRAIDAPLAWAFNDRINLEEGPIIIGIVEVAAEGTGFDINHTDLIGRIRFANGVHEERNEVGNHGTHVAGIIGATHNNGTGIAGVLRDVQMLAAVPRFAIMEVTFTNWVDEEDEDDEDEDDVLIVTTSIDILACLIDVVDEGAKVINFSMGGSGELRIRTNHTTEWVNEHARRASATIAILLSEGYDFVVVQTAGNGHGLKRNGKRDRKRIGVDAINNGLFASITAGNAFIPDGMPEWITADEILNRIIIVGSAEMIGAGIYRQALSSNGGPQVHIAAPGVDIYSTVASRIQRNWWSGDQIIFENNLYAYDSGTSMAAPIVTGVAGLVWSHNPNLTGAEVRNIVINSVDRNLVVTSNPDAPRANGDLHMVNAFLAVQAALRTLEEDIEIDTNAPIGTVDQVYAWHIQTTNGEQYSTWERTGGNLPDYYVLYSAGLLMGIPTAPGEFDIELRVRTGPNDDDFATATVSITIHPATSPPSGRLADPVPVTTGNMVRWEAVPGAGVYEITLRACGECDNDRFDSFSESTEDLHFRAFTMRSMMFNSPCPNAGLYITAKESAQAPPHTWSNPVYIPFTNRLDAPFIQYGNTDEHRTWNTNPLFSVENNLAVIPQYHDGGIEGNFIAMYVLQGSGSGSSFNFSVQHGRIGGAGILNPQCDITYTPDWYPEGSRVHVYVFAIGDDYTYTTSLASNGLIFNLTYINGVPHFEYIGTYFPNGSH
jgi:subtilisin family serine protease